MWEGPGGGIGNSDWGRSWQPNLRLAGLGPRSEPGQAARGEFQPWPAAWMHMCLAKHRKPQSSFFVLPDLLLKTRAQEPWEMSLLPEAPHAWHRPDTTRVIMPLR